MQALTDSRVQDHALIVDQIGWMGYLGTNMESAIPLLARCARERSYQCQESAVSALGNLAREPHISIPALTNCLETTSSLTLRLTAINSIARFGTNGRAGVPSLLRAVDDPDYFVQAAANSALQKIAPEKAQTGIFGP